MKKSPSLVFCLAMDAVGMLTYSIPFLGEFGDIVWAPVSAIIFYLSFGGRKGALGAIFNFLEEAVPFLDFIPTFTLAWLYARYSGTKQEPIRTNHSKLSAPTVIDIN
ncbi:MAG: hypothetical protein MUE71_00100 [Chitinophagaceae bacterium]|jgi:hypothetical protein|nr:hypothetical protein [Chitinophagaceae bacterium]MCU0403538.1 hypothetical protein [Chitinophagaceae bacterium]